MQTAEIDPNHLVSVETPDALESNGVIDPSKLIPASRKETPQYGEAPWGEVLTAAAKNAPSSFGNVIGDLYHAVTNPSETLGAVKQIGTGLYSKAEGALGSKQDPEEKAKTEQLVNAIGEHYAQTYGSAPGFKQTLATDPFSIGMDASAFVPVAGAGLRAAGLTSKATSLAGRAALGAAKTATTLMDPIQTALAVAKAPLKVADWGVSQSQAALSGVKRPMLSTIRELGATGDAEQRLAFSKFAKGQGDHAEIAQAGLNAVDEIKQGESAAYLQNRDAWARSQTQLPMDQIVQIDARGNIIGGALHDLNQFVNSTGTQTRFAGARKMVSDINDQVLETLHNPDPAARTMLDLDNLKQSIGDVYQETKGTRFSGKVGDVYDSIKETIAAHDPTYAAAMERWQQWRALALNYQKALSLNDRAGAAAIVAKMAKANVQPGIKKTLLQQLSETNAGKNIPAMLAGDAVNPWFASGMRGYLEYPGAAYALAVHPGTWPGVAAGAIASSPRLSGNIQYGLGMGKRVAAPFEPAVSAITGRPVRTGLYDIEQGLQEHTGGRIDRKTGGKVSDSAKHERLLGRLMALTEKAKRTEEASTKPLLNAPDEAIVHALHVANAAI